MAIRRTLLTSFAGVELTAYISITIASLASSTGNGGAASAAPTSSRTWSTPTLSRATCERVLGSFREASVRTRQL